MHILLPICSSWRGLHQHCGYFAKWVECGCLSVNLLLNRYVNCSPLAIQKVCCATIRHQVTAWEISLPDHCTILAKAFLWLTERAQIVITTWKGSTVPKSCLIPLSVWELFHDIVCGHQDSDDRHHLSGFFADMEAAKRNSNTEGQAVEDLKGRRNLSGRMHLPDRAVH